MFENIDINILYPHPNNPRKDLGDLTELTESIKAQGILQNLTVVKIKDSYYTVVIGHRRLAAARLAGLTEVPCSIADMDMKTQLSTMLLENMQRTDLTPYEQAKGFQTCLDFGVTIDELSAKTGLSKTTVKHRLKILELDPREVEKVESTSIFDFIKLEEIEDVNLRNKALKYIGTPNFDVEVKRLKEEEKKEEITNCLLATIKAYAKEVPSGYRNGWEYHQYIYLSSSTKTDIIIPEDANCDLDDPNYAYSIDRFAITILKKVNPNKKLDEFQEKQNFEREIRSIREEKMNKELSLLQEVRLEFIKQKLSSMTLAEHESLSTVLMFMLLSKLFCTQFYRANNYETIEELSGLKLGLKDTEDDEDEVILKHLRTLKGKEFYKFILTVVIALYSDIDLASLMDYAGRFKLDTDAVDLYDLLEILGYQISDVEKSILDGSYELYVKGDNEND